MLKCDSFAISMGASFVSQLTVGEILLVFLF